MVEVIRPLALVALIMLSAPTMQQPVIQMVDPCTDEALDRALADAQPGDTVQFGCSGTILAEGGKLLTASITLDGAGHAVTISNDGTLPVFQVSKGITVTISHLGFAQNRADTTGTIENRGTLIVRDVQFTNAERGVYNGKQANLSVTASTFAGNDVGLLNLGTAVVNDSTFADNRRDGIYNRGTLAVIGSTLSGNGHGIDNDHGPLTVANSTFAGNHLSGGSGAGIANSGPLMVFNSTFAGNLASTGGAIYNHEGGTVTLRNTILADSGPQGNCAGPILDGGANLQYPGVTCGDSIPSADPGLLPLTDNGGLTRTMALSEDSPAIGAGDTTVCAAPPVYSRDQRGMPRLSADPAHCDIGAFEGRGTTDLN